jgi:hypothetical protein
VLRVEPMDQEHSRDDDSDDHSHDNDGHHVLTARGLRAATRRGS